MNARTLAITRAVAVIGGTGALIVGATFAATTTNQITANGTVAVSNNLTISQDNSVFAASANGFVFNTAPGSPSVAHSHIYLETTEPVSTVVLSAKITGLDPSLETNKAHLTLNFKINGNTVSMSFTDLEASDTSLAGLGALANTGSTSNDLEAWVGADPSTPVINSSNGIALQLTGTSDGSVTP